MPRHSIRPLLLLALIALTFLTPTLATAFPQEATFRSAAERPEASPGLFSKLRHLLSAVWFECNCFGLKVEGGSNASSGPGSDPNAATGDNGSALEPDGK